MTAEEKDEKLITSEREKRKKHIKSPIIFVLIAILVVAGVAYFINESHYQETDDAYVETHAVQVAPKISGQVVKMLVTDNQEVKAGDLVAVIDPADYAVRLSSLSAKYDSTLLKQKNAKAAFDAAKSQTDLAKTNLTRYTNLYKAGAASKQEYDNAKTTYDNANAGLIQANQALLSKGNSRVADADLKEIAADRKAAALNLSYTRIYAPQSGYVTSKSIEKGAYVQVGQALFTIVPHKVWVTANYKESQLTYMRVGQPVEIKIDAYPNKIFKGKVDSIQRSSGAKSSLFPPENAVGSFVKIVQRIPVKIVFDEPIDTSVYTIVPGMSVEPKVRVK
jgi:membrane fusion protein (multidrug efflux system)